MENFRGSRHSELSRFATFPVNRPPAASTAAGLAAAEAKLAPAVRQLGQTAPAPLSLAALAALATTLWGSYLLALPRTAALLEPRREVVLRQITRE